VPTVVEELTLRIGPDEVWVVVGDFVGFVKAIGYPVEGRDSPNGPSRVVRSPGGVIIERLESLDNSGRTFSYVIDSAGPLPVKNYRSTMQVGAVLGGGSLVTWTATFDAVGVDDATAIDTIRGLLKAALKALSFHLCAN
jgi:Polyketide cyclase / dehydrase and lipid transport